MTCSTSSEAEAFIQGIADPPEREENIEVAPRERLRLNLYVAALTPGFKDSHPRCRIDLTLDDGTVVKSPEFTSNYALSSEQ